MANKIWLGNDSGNEGDVSVAANWSPSGVPVASDNVRLVPRDTMYALTAGLSTLSGVALASFVVDEGFNKAIGDNDNYLQITTSAFTFNGAGVSRIDLEASSVSPEILGTGNGGTGRRGLYLKGSAIGTIDVHNGDVGIAVKHGETSTVATARVSAGNASLWLGNGVTLSTAYYQQDGTDCRVLCDAPLMTIYDGGVTTDEDAAITNAKIYGGQLVSNASGTLATLDIYGGEVDFLQSAVSRTVTTLNIHRQQDGSLRLDKSIVTVTNGLDGFPSGPLSVDWTGDV